MGEKGLEWKIHKGVQCICLGVENKFSDGASCLNWASSPWKLTAKSCIVVAGTCFDTAHSKWTDGLRKTGLAWSSFACRPTCSHWKKAQCCGKTSPLEVDRYNPKCQTFKYYTRELHWCGAPSLSELKVPRDARIDTASYCKKKSADEASVGSILEDLKTPKSGYDNTFSNFLVQNKKLTCDKQTDHRGYGIEFGIGMEAFGFSFEGAAGMAISNDNVSFTYVAYSYGSTSTMGMSVGGEAFISVFLDSFDDFYGSGYTVCFWGESKIVEFGIGFCFAGAGAYEDDNGNLIAKPAAVNQFGISIEAGAGTDIGSPVGAGVSIAEVGILSAQCYEY